MKHIRSLDGIRLTGSWLTIGSFDGVHRGHQEIIQRLIAGAHNEGAPAVVLTFFPHPAVVLGKRHDPYYLTSPDSKAKVLGRLGVDLVVTYPFDLEVAQTPAKKFIANIYEHLKLSRLIVGSDFALGKNREGNIENLAEYGRHLGYEVEVMPAITENDQRISSSAIRSLLAEGKVNHAGELLGRPYGFWGEVIPGDGRGRTIGVPTANLSLWEHQALPKSGVYVCRVRIGSKVLGAVTNIGVRPTFYREAGIARVETHILDFQGQIYGEKLYLEFLGYLRSEKRFPNVDALINQIRVDIQKAKEALEVQGLPQHGD